MASNYTANYGLCQWEPGDAFLREEFNRDLETLDGTLHRVDGLAAENRRGLDKMAYIVYDLVLRDHYEHKRGGFRQALIFSALWHQELIASLSGGLYVRDNALCLDGAGKTGVMTTHSLVLGSTTWTRAIAWARYSLGESVTMAVNGTPLPWTEGWSARTLDGIHCWERQFEAKLEGRRTAVITLTMETREAESAKAYDYGVMFL